MTGKKDHQPAEHRMAGAVASLSVEIATIEQDIERFTAGSRAVGGYATLSDRPQAERAAGEALDLLVRRDELETAATRAREDERGRLVRLDVVWRADLEHFLVANPERRRRALERMLRNPGADVPWWWSERNACDPTMLTPLALGELDATTVRERLEHLAWCGDCRQRYDEARERAGLPELDLQEVVHPSPRGARGVDLTRLGQLRATAGCARGPDADVELTIFGRATVRSDGMLRVIVQTPNLALQGWQVQGQIVTAQPDPVHGGERIVPICGPLESPAPLVLESVDGTAPRRLMAELRWKVQGEARDHVGQTVQREHFRFWLVPPEVGV